MRRRGASRTFNLIRKGKQAEALAAVMNAVAHNTGFQNYQDLLWQHAVTIAAKATQSMDAVEAREEAVRDLCDRFDASFRARLRELKDPE